MKIALVILGTRGDVQPMVALATGLMKRGHDVTIFATPENESFVRKNNCPFVPFGPDLKKEVKEKPEGQKGGVVITISPRQGRKIVSDQMSILPGLIKNTDLVLGAGIVLGVQTAADILNVPYRYIAFYPIILGTTADDPLKNRLLFSLGRSVINMFLKGFINKYRAQHSLLPIKDVWAHWIGEKTIIACDKELHPAREGVAFPFVQTGFMLLPSGIGLPEPIREFISSGKPPVYIGFGSNPIVNAGSYTRLFEKVQNITKQRLIISKGWAGFSESKTTDILYADEMPFDQLFPQMAAAIYHGGTGTMAAIARAGIPQAAFPFMGDQFSNQKQIVKLGLGPETCDFKKMSAESVASAIQKCLTDNKYREAASEMAQRLQNVNGLKLTVDFIEKEFEK